MIGQPEFLEKVGVIPQLQQRLGIKYHLVGLNFDETKEYISHRLSVAGAESNMFTEGAIEVIYDYSEGLPRKINNICDMSLLVGFGQETKTIDTELANKLAVDLNTWGRAYAKNV
ncbi:unnamed protein product [marine sediment metagenome]|uniref:Uncharacterized protein n=1 Tax=marine sediment metagenome TaxID=412755 RepID=X0X145_9ZZZZ